MSQNETGTYFAYCPIGMDHNEALAYVKQYLRPNTVIKVFKNYKGELSHAEAPYTKPRANAYGFDLYLYHFDTSSQKETYLDCGGFN